MNTFSLIRFIVSHPLNKTQPIAAVGRFLRWQFACRLLNAPTALPFVDDTKLVMERGMTGATGNWYCGLHEPDDMGLVLHLLRAGDTFFDIGANVGSYTVIAAGAVGADVVAAEPIPGTFAKLQRNIRFNDLKVLALCCGISGAPGELRFISDSDTMNRIALETEHENTTVVPVRTLDSLPGQPKLMKIDVEGHEMAVLEGGHSKLSSPELLAVIMETNGAGEKFGTDDGQLISKMASYGFGMFSYDPFKRELRAAGAGIGNTIFARDPDAINALCQGARHYKLCNGTI